MHILYNYICNKKTAALQKKKDELKAKKGKPAVEGAISTGFFLNNKTYIHARSLGHTHTHTQTRHARALQTFDCLLAHCTHTMYIDNTHTHTHTHTHYIYIYILYI
jgi:hypothetical protein